MLRNTTRTCSVDGCEGVYYAKSFCQRHYTRGRYPRQSKPAGWWREYYRRERKPRPTLEERFWAKVEKTDGCWLWQGYKTVMGYGRINVDGHAVGAHRVAYEMLVGPIPVALTLDHLCRNPGCVRPDHLEPVTLAENSLRSNIVHPRGGRPRKNVEMLMHLT